MTVLPLLLSIAPPSDDQISLGYLFIVIGIFAVVVGLLGLYLRSDEQVLAWCFSIGGTGILVVGILFLGGVIPG